jgi:competence protein ComEA
VKSFFRNYFVFNQVELKGIRILLGVMIFFAVVYFLMPLFMGGKQKFDGSAYQASVDSFMRNTIADTSWDWEDRTYPPRYADKREFTNKEEADFVMKPFDPNGLPKEIWMEMGLSEKQAQVIKNYESKGGKFKTKEDVKKQFVITDEFYRKIEPYILFAEINDEVNSEHAALSLDINHANKEDFMLINGIKDYLAEDIIKYRSRLGGFTTMEQLKEIKYLSQKVYDNLIPHCFITSYSVKKIHINLAEWKELAPHPYIGGDVATKIVDYRKKNGLFKNAEDFKRSGLVDEALYAKLVPYLSFMH